MRIDPELSDIDVLPLPFFIFGLRKPHDLATERPLEMADRFHHYRIDKLLMELRIAFARRQALL